MFGVVQGDLGLADFQGGVAVVHPHEQRTGFHTLQLRADQLHQCPGLDRGNFNFRHQVDDYRFDGDVGREPGCGEAERQNRCKPARVTHGCLRLKQNVRPDGVDQIVQPNVADGPLAAVDPRPDARAGAALAGAASSN